MNFGMIGAGLVMGIILVILWVINLIYMFGFGGYDTYMDQINSMM